MLGKIFALKWCMFGANVTNAGFRGRGIRVKKITKTDQSFGQNFGRGV